MSSYQDVLQRDESGSTFSTPLLDATPTLENTPQNLTSPGQYSGDFSPYGRRGRLWWFCLVQSILMLVVIPIYVQYRIRQGIIDQVVIDSEHAMGFPMFCNRSAQGGTNMEYTFFNITNPYEVLKGEKPHLEEIGPFIYHQTQLRSDVQFNYEDDTIGFRQQIYQTFLPKETLKRTNGRFNRDDVKFLSTNILFFGMKAVVGKEAWHLINDITLWDNDFKRLFDTRTVREMIEGYSVPLKVGPVVIPISFPGLVPSHVKANTDPEFKFKSKIYMGKKSLKNTNSLVEFGPGKTHSQVLCPWGNNPLSADCSRFRDNPCCGVHLAVMPWGKEIFPGLWNEDANKVQGTFGDAFRPYLRRSDDEKVVVWSDQLVRPLQFHNRNGLTVNHHGIELLRFTATAEFWANSTIHPPNARYYQYGPNGLLNASVIYVGAPIFASLPHFLYADPALLEGVTGLNPDPDLHDMFIDVEPHTGMTFREHNRIQVSAKITGKESYGLDVWFPKVKDAYVPIGYFDAHSEINQVGVEDFLQLYNGLSIFWGTISMGAVFMTLTLLGHPIFVWFQKHHRSRKSRTALLQRRSLQSVLVYDDDEHDNVVDQT